jgi:DNA polymerase III delta subunit
MARAPRKQSKKSDALTPAEFMNHVDKGRLQSVYVFVGDDLHAMEHAVAALRRACVPGDMQDFCLEVLHAESDAVTGAEIIAAAETMPFMGSTRVVIVKHADELRADDLTPLAEYIETQAREPREGMVLVLLFNALDKRTKFARSAYAGKLVVEFSAAPVTDVAATMQERHGKTITPGAVRILEEFLAGDARGAYSELEKVCLYVGERNEVTEADVLAVCVDSATRNEWELAERLVQGNRAAALDALRRMRQSGADTMYQYTIIATALSRLPGAAAALSDGTLYKNWYTYRISYSDPHRRAIEEHLRSLTPANQSRALRWLMYLDICLKGTALPGELLCELTCLATE